MSSQSYSSLGTGTKRRGVLHDDIDRSVYTVGQTLASIVNDPRTAHQTGGGFWGLGHDASQLPQPPPLDPAKYPPVTTADLQQYIQLVHGAYERFIRDRQSLEAFDAKHQPGSSDPRAGSASQGEPFMAAVQVVPMPFFQEGFFDNWDEFFRQYCKEQTADELYEQIDQLNKNLDVVELQLLREVASRSDSFFQAAASLQHLLGMLGDSVGSIRGLRRSLAESDEQMYSTAVAVKGLQARRSNLQATLDITKGLEEVMAAQAALDCMLEGGDYAGALQLLAELKSLLEQPGLMGLQCVRHLPPRLLETTAAVERALAAEFLQTLVNGDVARVVAEAAADAEVQPVASVSTDGRAAPGSTWQLPPSSMRDAAAAREQLHEKLLPLAVGLYRAERLPAALQQYKAAVGDEVKGAVRDAVQQVLPVLLVAAGEQQQQQLGQAGSETQLADQLQLLHHGAFMVLLHAAARVIFSCVDHAVAVGQLLEATLAGINTPASQLAALRKECSAALQVVVDVGLGRWVKLLAARSAANMRLKQYELRQLLDLSEQVASYTETLGARTLGSFRSALQAQCKGLLDASHARSMNQLQHLLESEQWVAVEVPGGFQAIVDRLVARCGEGAALLDGRQHSPAPASTPAAAAAATDDGSSGSSESRSATLQLCGKSFHLVNSGLMLLKMLDEYMSLYELMPQFGAEIVHRELELLKLFNSQTAALVLGAGAMRTAGLRSISAKQLALSCQAVAMLATLLPLLRAGSLGLVSQPRRALLMPEFDRLLQDLTMHMDEVHSKLVDIMRDRLAAAVQTLPGEVRQSAANPALAPNPDQPSHTIALLVKQLGTLRAVLAPYLLKEELEFIFGAVARAYSDALSETFEVLLDQDGACEGVVRANALSMLQAFRDLPLDPTRSSNYCSRLSTTYTKHFGLPPWDQQRLGQQVQQQQQGLQEQDSSQLQHAAPQQLQEQESDQLTAHQQQPELEQQQSEPQQQQLEEDQQQSQVHEQQERAHLEQPQQQQQQQIDPAGSTEQPSVQPVSEQGSTDQQLHGEPGALAAAAAAAAAATAVAPLGAVEQFGQEQHLEHAAQHTPEQQQQQQQEQLESELGEQPPAPQQHEAVPEQQQQQQQQAPELHEQVLAVQQMQQPVDAAGGVEGQEQNLLLDSTLDTDSQEQQQQAVQDSALPLDASQGNAPEKQLDQQPLQRQHHNTDMLQEQHEGDTLATSPAAVGETAAATAAAEDAAEDVVADVDVNNVHGGDILKQHSTEATVVAAAAAGLVSGITEATDEQQQQQPGEEHTDACNREQQQQQPLEQQQETQQQQQQHSVQQETAAVEGWEPSSEQHGNDMQQQEQQQQEQQLLPSADSASLADLLDGFEQPLAAAAVAQEGETDAQQRQQQAAQPAALSDGVVNTTAAGTSPAAAAGDLLGDWGVADAQQEAGSAAAAADGDADDTSSHTAPLQQQQQGSSRPANAGGLLDLLWEDAGQQQQQQQQQGGIGSSSSWQQSSSLGNGVQLQNVDSFDELSLLDEPPSDTAGGDSAAAAVPPDDAVIAADAQHVTSGNGDTSATKLQQQPAEPLAVEHQQLADSDAAGPADGDGSKGGSSNGSAAQASLPSSGSWDPLNASSAPPTAATVEGNRQ